MYAYITYISLKINWLWLVQKTSIMIYLRLRRPTFLPHDLLLASLWVLWTLVYEILVRTLQQISVLFHVALWHTTCHLTGASFISCPVFCMCLPCRLILCCNCKLYTFPRTFQHLLSRTCLCEQSHSIVGQVWFQRLQVICFLIT